MSNLTRIRTRAGWSRERAAAAAGVSSPTVRLYEVEPSAIKDERKREALDQLWSNLEQTVAGETRRMAGCGRRGAE